MSFNLKKEVGNVLDKIGLKKQVTKVDLKFNNYYNNVIKYVRFFYIPKLVKYRSRKGVLAVDLDSDWIGLGARIIKTIEILLYCQENNLTPLIRYNYREKLNQHTDYFKELFYYKNSNIVAYKNTNAYTNIRDIDELGLPANYNLKLKLSFAKNLFDKYLGINPEILEEVSLFKKKYFNNSKVLGVHYRGTDKAGEAPLVASYDLLNNINSILEEEKELQLIFISTDDEKMLHLIKDAGLPARVIYREDAFRSKDGDQFHRKVDSPKSIINHDAIINMLILSECDYLLKTASILSDCSVIFNPSIPLKVISFPHTETLTWWPAIEIKKMKTNYAIIESK